MRGPTTKRELSDMKRAIEFTGSVIFLLLTWAMIYLLFAAFADAQTPTGPDLPKWSFGKPQSIEDTLFP